MKELGSVVNRAPVDFSKLDVALLECAFLSQTLVQLSAFFMAEFLH